MTTLFGTFVLAGAVLGGCATDEPQLLGFGNRGDASFEATMTPGTEIDVPISIVAEQGWSPETAIGVLVVDTAGLRAISTEMIELTDPEAPNWIRGRGNVHLTADETLAPGAYSISLAAAPNSDPEEGVLAISWIDVTVLAPF